MVGIELDDIQFPGHHARFFGSIKSMVSEVPGFQWFYNSVTTKTTQVFKVEEVSGVGTFFMQGASFRLPEGTVMLWQSQ